MSKAILSGWRNLKMGQAHSVSLIEKAKAETPFQVQYINIPDCPEPIQIIRSSQILYEPRLGLQILPDGGVPTECVDKRDLEFVRSRGELPDDYFNNPRTPRYYDNEACILTNFYSRNLMHWVTEELVKVSVLEGAGFVGSYVISGQPDFSYEFLDCLGVSANRLIDVGEEPCVFSSTVLMTPINHQNLLRLRGVFFQLRNKLLSAASPNPSRRAPRRLWLDRQLTVRNVRQFINAPEVYELIARYGFEVVDMAAYSVRDQIAIARGAEALMGMHGAAFIHAMFMQFNSAVIECFSPEFINSGFQEICYLLRHRYAMVVHPNAYGAYPYGKSLKVDLVQLELAIRSLNLVPIQ